MNENTTPHEYLIASCSNASPFTRTVEIPYYCQRPECHQGSCAARDRETGELFEWENSDHK